MPILPWLSVVLGHTNSPTLWESPENKPVPVPTPSWQVSQRIPYPSLWRSPATCLDPFLAYRHHWPHFCLLIIVHTRQGMHIEFRPLHVFRDCSKPRSSALARVLRESTKLHWIYIVVKFLQWSKPSSHSVILVINLFTNVRELVGYRPLCWWWQKLVITAGIYTLQISFTQQLPE